MICLYIGSARVEDRKKTRRRRRRRYLSIRKNICDAVCVIYLYYTHHFTRLSRTQHVGDPIPFGFIGRSFIISTILILYYPYRGMLSTTTIRSYV